MVNYTMFEKIQVTTMDGSNPIRTISLDIIYYDFFITKGCIYGRIFGL